MEIDLEKYPAQKQISASWAPLMEVKTIDQDSIKPRILYLVPVGSGVQTEILVLVGLSSTDNPQNSLFETGIGPKQLFALAGVFLNSALRAIWARATTGLCAQWYRF